MSGSENEMHLSICNKNVFCILFFEFFDQNTVLYFTLKYNTVFHFQSV